MLKAHSHLGLSVPDASVKSDGVLSQLLYCNTLTGYKRRDRR